MHPLIRGVGTSICSRVPLSRGVGTVVCSRVPLFRGVGTSVCSRVPLFRGVGTSVCSRVPLFRGVATRIAFPGSRLILRFFILQAKLPHIPAGALAHSVQLTGINFQQR